MSIAIVTASDLISTLKELGIHVQLKGEMLKVVAPGKIVEDKVLKELKDRKTEIVSLLKRQEGYGFNHIPQIEEQQYYRASHAQRRLWILNQIDENKLAYK